MNKGKIVLSKFSPLMAVDAALAKPAGETVETPRVYSLCRFGKSNAKPFCDGVPSEAWALDDPNGAPPGHAADMRSGRKLDAAAKLAHSMTPQLVVRSIEIILEVTPKPPVAPSHADRLTNI